MWRICLTLALCVCVSAHYKRQYYYGRNDIYKGRYYNRGLFYNGGRYTDIKPFQPCGRSLARRYCPLFNFGSDLVTMDDFRNTVLTGDEGWFPIYTIEIGTPAKYGRCRNRFNMADANGVFLKEEKCFNLDSQMCDDFTINLMLTEDECGRVKSQGVTNTDEETYYSQDLNQYYWRDICASKNSAGDCEQGRYIDLTIRSNRLVDSENGTVPDLTSLPWDLFAADLKNIYGRDFRDPEVRYAELGQECTL